MKKAYQLFFSSRKLIQSSLIAFLLLGGSLLGNFYAGSYANEKGITPVTDIVLSNTRAYDVDALFIGGIIVFFLFILGWCIRYPAQTPYILKSIALFIAIRAVFVTLTHLGPYPDSILILNTGIMGKINFGADLFFSGHTGMPFLMALIFWENKLLRYLFILAAISFGIIVLLGHLHYSIDVLAAFFITYTIHHLGELLWKKDKVHFDNASVRIS
ncbi:MAG: phosphatase PAP2-related protein [candidate division SR1 bacterium]|nr:phosphatase PAP2-related protein [candidate division SR1 bacterium]